MTGLYFDKDDRIGLTISRTSGDYVTNRLMTYDGERVHGLRAEMVRKHAGDLDADGLLSLFRGGGSPPHSVWRPTSGRAAHRRIWVLSHGGQAGQRTRRDGFLSPHVAPLRGRGEQRFLAGRRSEDRRFGRRAVVDLAVPRRRRKWCGGGADRGFRGGARFRYRAVLAADDAGCRGGVAGFARVPQIRFRRPARRRQVLRPPVVISGAAPQIE